MTLSSSKTVDLIPSAVSDFFNADNFFTTRFLPFAAHETIPSANVKETDTQFTIEVAAPGYRKEDLKIRLDESTLTVQAEKQEEKKEEKNEEKESYRRREFSYSSFTRSFTLPKSAEGAKAQASYRDGIMTIVVPKKAAEAGAPVTQIPVQ
ncbi:MAG: Hsp20/alpha crystallin family protein [Candidatus Kapaibacterium sp.]|jgi:HSP20 family protein